MMSAGFDDDHDRHDATAGDSFESMFAHLLYHLRDSHRGICIKLVAEIEGRQWQSLKNARILLHGFYCLKVVS